MKTIRLNANGNAVSTLQKLLSKAGYPVAATGKFTPQTDQIVRQFQQDNNLVVDGIVGKNTWRVLFKKGYTFSLGVKNYSLESHDFFPEYYNKNSIFLHHTAGRERPDYTIHGWKMDNEDGPRRVATAFVIGRRGLDGDSSYDGVTFRAFREHYWAHHLGLKLPQNDLLNSQSIGIEICNTGYLEKANNGTFYFVTKNGRTQIPASEVYTLDQPWRGQRYFQKYTVKQLEECKRLILTLALIFDIPIPNRNYNREWFDMQPDALAGKPGLWTHVNVRRDKTDCFPQPELIAMLNTLHEASKTFAPTESALESFWEFEEIITLDDNLAKNYSSDLDDAKP